MPAPQYLAHCSVQVRGFLCLISNGIMIRPDTSEMVSRHQTLDANTLGRHQRKRGRRSLPFLVHPAPPCMHASNRQPMQEQTPCCLVMTSCHGGAKLCLRGDSRRAASIVLVAWLSFVPQVARCTTTAPVPPVANGRLSARCKLYKMAPSLVVICHDSACGCNSRMQRA